MGEPIKWRQGLDGLGRVGGFAPGDYTAKCVKCAVQFIGDKRAVVCLPCAVEGMASRLEKLESANRNAGAELDVMICEPLTLAGSRDAVQAVRDFHELFLSRLCRARALLNKEDGNG